MIVIDATGCVLGRMASVIAKKLLMGEEIVVVNAGDAVVSGRPQMVREEFLEMRQRGSNKKGPFYPRYPDRIIKRTVRGMLPRKKARGRDALSRLTVHSGCPSEFSGKAERVGKTVEELSCKYIMLKDISRALGAKSERL